MFEPDEASSVRCDMLRRERSSWRRDSSFTPVTATVQHDDDGWDVETPGGTIQTQVLVNATGLWGQFTLWPGWNSR